MIFCTLISALLGNRQRVRRSNLGERKHRVKTETRINHRASAARSLPIFCVPGAAASTAQGMFNDTRNNDWPSWQLPSVSESPRNYHSARERRCPLFNRAADWNIIWSSHNKSVLRRGLLRLIKLTALARLVCSLVVIVHRAVFVRRAPRKLGSWSLLLAQKVWPSWSCFARTVAGFGKRANGIVHCLLEGADVMDFSDSRASGIHGNSSATRRSSRSPFSPARRAAFSFSRFMYIARVFDGFRSRSQTSERERDDHRRGIKSFPPDCAGKGVGFLLSFPRSSARRWFGRLEDEADIEASFAECRCLPTP